VRPVAVFIGLVLAVVLTPTAALAARPATEAERAGIAGMIGVGAECVEATVSTVDPAYALVNASYAEGCDYPRGLLGEVVHSMDGGSTWVSVFSTGETLDCPIPELSTDVAVDLGVCFRPDPRTYLCSADRLQVKPKRWYLGCPATRVLISKLRWRRWGSDRARATGVIALIDCDPDCARGRYHRYRVRLTASRIRVCPASPEGPGKRQYTRVRVEYRLPRDNPHGIRPGWQRSTVTANPRACS